MNTPKIRFKGFKDDWEQRKWIDTVDISTEMVNPASGEYDEFQHIAPGNIESFTGRILDNVKTVKEEQLISGKFRFRPGDVVYGKINPQLGKYFYASTDGLTSADAYVLNGKNGLTQEFLFSLLQTVDFFKYSISVSKRSGMPKINRDELNAYSFFAPDEAEQKKIGTFLLDIDHLITLHQRKCDETKQLKKFMLQKMFPENGEKNPEIRFEGFTDDWEQRKFGELVNEIREKTKSENEDTLLSCAIDGMYLNSELFSHFRGSSNIGYLKVKKNDLILSAQNLHLGNCNVNLRFEHGIISPAYKVYELVDCNPLFIQAWVKQDSTKDFFLKASTEGASVCRKNIVWEELYEQTVSVPEIKEQEKIGYYFRSLDHLITLHQRKCEKLKELKKFMLQNMFV